MTKNELSAIITSLLETASTEVAASATVAPEAQSAWVVHMTTAKVCTSLATAFMCARDNVKDNLYGKS